MMTQSGLTVDIKIQSITDIITNSSTSIITMYNLNDKQEIKNIVNAILAIEGNHTFDDFFTIRMLIDDYVAMDIYQHYEEYQEKYPTEDDFIAYLDGLSDEELDHWDDIAKDMTYDPITIFSGYTVNIKEGVEETTELKQAINAIQSISCIFDYEADYNG